MWHANFQSLPLIFIIPTKPIEYTKEIFEKTQTKIDNECTFNSIAKLFIDTTPTQQQHNLNLTSTDVTEVGFDMKMTFEPFLPIETR